MERCLGRRERAGRQLRRERCRLPRLAAEGLKREFKVTVAASEIESRVQSRLERLAKTVRLPGFRPGKAPLPLLKKQYGRSILGEVLEEAVDEGSKKTIGDNQLRPALRPEDRGHLVRRGQGPRVRAQARGAARGAAGRARRHRLTRLVAEVPPDKVEEAIENFAKLAPEVRAARPSRARRRTATS